MTNGNFFASVFRFWLLAQQPNTINKSKSLYEVLVRNFVEIHFQYVTPIGISKCCNEHHYFLLIAALTKDAKLNKISADVKKKTCHSINCPSFRILIDRKILKNYFSEDPYRPQDHSL